MFYSGCHIGRVKQTILTYMTCPQQAITIMQV